MEFTSEAVASALHQFYSTNDENVRSELNRWLLRAQDSVQAWRFAWTILDQHWDHLAQHDLALHLFAANCLYHKLSGGRMDEYLDEFGATTTAANGENNNSEAADAHLRASLIDICTRTSGSKVVRNKLAMALSAYVCYATPDIWPDAIEDLTKRWGATEPTLLFDVLASVPVESSNMPMPIERRSAVRGSLRNRETFVVETTRYLLQNYFSRECVVEAIVRCVETWVDFCNNAAEWVNILAMCLQCGLTMKGSSLSTVSKFFVRFMENTEIRRMENFVGQLFDFLAPALNFEKGAGVDDEEYEENVADMCVGLLENQTGYMLKHLTERESIRTLVNQALLLANSPGLYPIDETNSGKTFNFWRNFYEDALSEENFATRSAFLAILEPVYVQLSDILLRKLKYPPAFFDTWSASDRELFAKYRADGGDAFACCYRILSATTFLHSIVNEKYSTALEKAWEEVEVIFYCLESIGDYVSNTQHSSSSIRVFFEQHLPKSPIASSVALANTALRMITKYAHIISDDLRLLTAVWEHVIGKCLTEPSTVHEATIALECLVRDGDVVLSADNGLCSSIFLAAHNCFYDSRFDYRDQLRALSAGGYVLSMQPNEVILKHLNEFLAPRMQRLQHVIEGKAAACTKQELLIEFDVLSSLITTLGGSRSVRSRSDGGNGDDPSTNPAYLIVSQSFGLFEALYATSPTDSELVAKIVDTLKRALTILMDDAKSVAPQYCRMIILLFPPHTNVLSLAKMLFLLFAGEGSEELTSTAMVALFEQLVDRIGDYNDQQAAAKAAEDATESFLALCYQLAKKRWTFLVKVFDHRATNFDCSLRIACRAICDPSISSSPLVLQAAQVICEMFSHSADSPAVAAGVQKYADTLMVSCFERLRVELLHKCVECVADVIFSVIHHFNRQQQQRQKFGAAECRWRQNPHVAAALSDPILVAMMKEIGNKRKFREYAKKYNIECRKGARVIVT